MLTWLKGEFLVIPTAAMGLDTVPCESLWITVWGFGASEVKDLRVKGPFLGVC